MAKLKLYLFLLVVSVTGALAPILAPASALYKWRDHNGALHYSDAVPPGDARNNREVINPRGVTLKSLPGRKTLAQQRAEARQRAARKAVRAHQRADRVLLDTYTSVKDIKQARDHRLASIRSQIHIARANIAHLEHQVAALKSRVSALKREPKAARDKLTQQLRSTRMTLFRDRRFLQGRLHARALVKKTFSTDIARFKALQARQKKFELARRSTQ